MASKKPEKPYKQAEFAAFLETLKSGTSSHWSQIGEVLGIDKNTITQWKKLPEAQKAIKEGIQDAMNKMETTGAKDWKMWKEKLGMLGIQTIDKSDITSDGERLEAPIIYKPKHASK